MAVAKEAVVTKFDAARRPALMFGRLKEREQAYREWFADIPAGVAIEAVSQPDYWAHHVKSIRPLDTIECFCEDGLWEAKFRVMFVGANEVKLSSLYIVEHEEPATASLSEDYDVKWLSPSAKYAVINAKNGAIIKDKLYPRSEAAAFLKQHLGKMRG